ncbi:MAG: cell division protein ZipA [Gammaproteobacteria bacterium]|nr:cell division protein ZipA [Gammaproteobacteria bacterium]
MLTTLILCVLGLSLIGVGGYLWYRRNIEDESSFGHDDVRWEQIDTDDSSLAKKAVSDIDQLTAITMQHQSTDDRRIDRNANFVTEGREEARELNHAELRVSTIEDDSFDEELDQLGKLMRESHETYDSVAVDSSMEDESDHLAAGQLQALQDKPIDQAKLSDDAEMVVSVHVVAKSGRTFHGDQLLEAFDQVGLQHGDRDIFHFFDAEQEGGPIRFSAANMMEPGTFDLKNMGEVKTHGLTLFMLLPGENNNAQTFDSLLDAGNRLAKRLGGELHDSQRSTLTSQGANLIKESIHQFYSRRKMYPDGTSRPKGTGKQGQLNL